VSPPTKTEREALRVVHALKGADMTYEEALGWALERRDQLEGEYALAKNIWVRVPDQNANVIGEFALVTAEERIPVLVGMPVTIARFEVQETYDLPIWVLAWNADVVLPDDYRRYVGPSPGQQVRLYSYIGVDGCLVPKGPYDQKWRRYDDPTIVV
jgi:hypothetical protein